MCYLKHLVWLFVFLNASVIANDSTVAQDPFLWLESSDNPRTHEWLAEEESRSEAYFQNDQLRRALGSRLSVIMDFDLVDAPQEVGENYVFAGKLRGQQQLILYKMNSRGGISPIIEPEGADSLAGFVVHKDRALVAYGISNSGSDWQTWHIRNLETREELSDCVSQFKIESRRNVKSRVIAI